MKILYLNLSLTLCSSLVTKLPVRQRCNASCKSIGKHFSSTIEDEVKDKIYMRDESDDSSEVDEGAVQELLRQRKEAKENREFQKADSITYELLSSYSVSVSDARQSWCTGFTKGHFYTKSEKSEDNMSNLSEQEIDALLAKRMCARNDRKFDVADEILLDLEKAGVFVDDGGRMWGFLSHRDGYRKRANSAPNTSNLSDQEIEDLLAKRECARNEKKYDVADNILHDLQKSSIFVVDKYREWRYYPKGHDYKKPANYDQNALTLSEEQIDELLAKRLNARNDRNYDIADKLHSELTNAGVVIDDQSRQWRIRKTE